MRGFGPGRGPAIPGVEILHESHCVLTRPAPLAGRGVHDVVAALCRIALRPATMC